MSGFGKSLFGFNGTGTAADVRRRGKVHEKKQKQQLVRKDKEEWDFYGLFPKRQIHVPRLPYPLWDGEWQDVLPQQQGPDAQKQRKVVRHILLIRHGQYDEKWAAENESEEEKKRDELMEDHRFYHKPFNPLTDVGRQQAECVGRHLAEIMEDSNRSGKVGITYMVNSRLVRAQETADIIAKHLPGNVRREKADRLLNEGEPAQFLPRKKKVSSMADTENYIALVDMDHARIEQAFTKYFGHSEWWKEKVQEHKAERAKVQNNDMSEGMEQNQEMALERSLAPLKEHDFETLIVVAHANVNRYFLCRALQLPPEGWIRFRLHHASMLHLIIQKTGHVDFVAGDVRHLPHELQTPPINMWS